MGFQRLAPISHRMHLLSLAQFVEAHGGRLSATPNLPQGAIFEFSVPADPDITS